ncbi:hypothetical protein BPIT_26690 [Candidatus Brocadia pituitae]|nr:hypothetical protein BPIT_26690 [Candidatus Brocadia pituitae]
MIPPFLGELEEIPLNKGGKGVVLSSVAVYLKVVATGGLIHFYAGYHTRTYQCFNETPIPVNGIGREMNPAQEIPTQLILYGSPPEERNALAGKL